MSLRKVKSGDPLVIPADAWNACIDAAEAHKRSQLGEGRTPSHGFRQAGLILVKNTSGSDGARCDVLGLGDPVFGPADNLDEFKSRLCLSAVALSSSHRGRFCVLLEPLAAGAIGLAWAAGICPAQVTIELSSHRCADIAADGTLTSCVSGSAQILWQAGTSGIVWCVLRLGVLSGEGTHDAPAILPGSGATADETTWDITDPPAGKDGVKFTPFRLYWSGTSGDPVYQFVRTPTYDSAGRLVAVSAEVRTTAFSTGAC